MPSHTPPKGCLVLFFGVWTVGGVLFCVFGFVLPMLRIQDARSWDEVPCTVLESRLGVHSDSEGTSYSVEVRFAYEVDGQAYESERYKLSSSSGPRGARERALERIPAGTETVCFVDPEEPDGAVLERGMTDEWIFGLVGLIFAAIGPGGYWLFSRASRRRQELGEELGLDVHGPTGTLGLTKSSTTYEMRDGAEGPIHLAPGTKRAFRTWALGFATLLWNGVTWGLLVVAVLREEHPETAAVVLGVGFAIAGVGLALAFVHALLGLLGPRIAVTLDEAHLDPGTETTLEYEVHGGTGGMTRLAFTLEERELTAGSESVSSRTRRTEELYETDRRTLFLGGTAELVVPADAEPSFEDEDSGRRWVLCARGTRSWRPDLREEWVLWVHPGGEAAGS